MYDKTRNIKKHTICLKTINTTNKNVNENRLL